MLCVEAGRLGRGGSGVLGSFRRGCWGGEPGSGDGGTDDADTKVSFEDVDDWRSFTAGTVDWVGFPS